MHWCLCIVQLTLGMSSMHWYTPSLSVPTSLQTLRAKLHNNLQVSTILGVAIKQQREERAWTEGVAIWVAVLVVSSVGELSAAAALSWS